MLAMLLSLELAQPHAAAVRGAQTVDEPLACLFLGAGKENALAPEHGRRMADVRQVYFPVMIFLRPLDRNRGCRAESRTVRAAEARPFLAAGRHAQQAQEQAGGTEKRAGKMQHGKAPLLSFMTSNRPILDHQARYLAEV